MSQIINDTFTEATDTALPSHTPDVGGAWSYHPAYGSSGFTVVGSSAKRCRDSAGAATETLAINATAFAGFSLFDVQCDIDPVASPANANYNGLIAGCDPTAATFYKLQYSQATNDIRLYRYNAGTPTQLGSPASYSYSVGVPFTIRMVRSGSSFTAYLNGSAVIGPVTDPSPLGSGVKCGMYAYAVSGSDLTDSAGVQFKNFIAADGAAGATSFTLSGPSAGPAGANSSSFAVRPNATYSGTFTPTPISGVTFSPATLTWSSTADAKTFTVSSPAGAYSINGTCSPSLTAPTSVAYTAKATTTGIYVVTGGTVELTTFYTINNLDATSFSARTSTGVTAQGSGVFSVLAMVPADYAGVIVWDQSTSGPFASESLQPPVGGTTLIVVDDD